MRSSIITLCGLNVIVLALSPANLRAAEDHTGLENFPKLSLERDWPWWRGPSRGSSDLRAADR